MDSIIEQIYKASLKFLDILSPEETYKAIVKEALKLVNAEYGSIFLGENDDLVRVYSSDPFFELIKVRREGIVNSVYKEDKFIINDVEKVAKIHPIIKKMGVKSVIYIPLSYKSESIGVLTLHSLKTEHFTGKEASILRLFGSMASLAIKKSQSYTETKKALEIRDMFMAMAAHELRTPLTSINGYIQLLHSRMAKLDTTEGKWVRELYDESKRMTSLVKELLEVNRIKSGQLQFVWQECHMTNVVSKSLEYMKVMHPERSIIFNNNTDEKSDVIIGDEDKLAQVLGNILDNAAKYSKKETIITLELTVKQQTIVVKVIDEGKGIAEKDLPYIFEGHKGETSGEEGIGIGLFFVESVVRQHHASINVKSQLKKGTTFEIKIPKAKL